MPPRKKIAIFCDGTWNDLNLHSPTNVVRLARSVAPYSDQDEQQIVYYDEGVGVGAGVGRVSDTLVKYVGGMLGRGLNRKIESAYRFLVLNYNPDDQLYIFGFSRGAYTARSLCGLIRKCGIVRRECFNKVPEALGRYRNGAHPDDPDMIEFRERFGNPRVTGRKEAQDWKGSLEKRDYAKTRSEIYQYRPDAFYQVMYLGVWDTVGALGIPSRLDLFGSNRRYRFHDTAASSLLSSIRHGIAANERRGLFDVTLFDNMDDLNREWAANAPRPGPEPLSVTDSAAPGFVPYFLRPYQQQWLPGDHGSVGGGHSNRRLSSGGLLWIAEGAAWAGLKLSYGLGQLEEAQREQDVCGEMGKNGSPARPAGAVRAQGPAHLGEVSHNLLERWHRDSSYRPENITVLRGVEPQEIIASRRTPQWFPHQ